MRSMTGFAAQKATWTLHHGKVDVVMSMKSVNSRFLETTFKIPYMLAHVEIDILKILKRELLRGHILITLHVSDQSLFKGNVIASVTTAQDYINAAHLIQEKTGIEGSLTLAHVINLPNVFSIQEQPLDENYKETLLTLTQSVTKALIDEQQKEGAVLAQDLQQRVDRVKERIHKIESLQEVSMELRKNSILNELNEYTTKDNTVIEVRKATLYHILDKIDIHEEIVRFKSHLTHMQELLASSIVELGKRLDFILQELGREINTIAAKCSDTDISALAIDIKIELEKAREQVQNIV